MRFLCVRLYQNSLCPHVILKSEKNFKSAGQIQISGSNNSEKKPTTEERL
nr:MAG TPA: hypothetical protein [Caudoviricetes sp.]